MIFGIYLLLYVWENFLTGINLTFGLYQGHIIKIFFSCTSVSPHSEPNLVNIFLRSKSRRFGCKPTYEKTWSGSLLMWSDLTLAPFTVKRELPHLKVLITHLLLLLDVWDVKPTYGKGPWAPPSRLNEDNHT